MASEAPAEYVASYLSESVDALTRFAGDAESRERLLQCADAIATSLRAGGKLMIAGNGGSAADAQHIAGEFVVRLVSDRAPLSAIALTTDASVMTACSNDYGFDHVFERQVRALGRRGDVFLAISTSGKSRNVLLALEAARTLGLTTLGFSGGDGGEMGSLCDLLLIAPSAKTALIQQIHITAAHVVCALVERAVFAQVL